MIVISDDKTPLDRTTPARHSDNTLNPFPDDRKKYRATTLWNSIIRHFREEMPVKRHRRQLTYFDDSFTGKEAVDFLMELLPRLILEGRQVDRSNCTTLLQKFTDQGFIKKARAGANEKEPFRDNATLYIFAEECNLLGISRTPRLVRTSSCHEESRQRARTPPPPPRFDRLLESPSEFTYRKLPSPKPLHGFNRRMSSSHGNLLSLLPPSNMGSNSADSVAETIDSRKVEVNFELRPSPIKEYNTPVAMTCRNRRQNKKISLMDKKKSPLVAKSPENRVTSAVPCDGDEERDGAYEWLSFMRRRRPEQTSQKTGAQRKLVNPITDSNEPDESAHLIEKRKRNSNSTQNSQITTTIYAPLQVTHRYITEVDTWSIWKDCLLARLRQILHLEELPFIRWKIVGQDVKWNCQRIGNSGVVKQRAEREDFSGYILRLMRYLEQFPFPTGSSNVIIYKDNQEVNVFKTVCSRLSRESTMLTNAEASALVHVLSLQDKKETSRKFHGARHASSFRSSLQIETEFTEDPPRSRVVPRYATCTLPHRVSSALSTNSSRSSHIECPDPPNARTNDCYLQRSRKVLQELRENVPNGAGSRSYQPQGKCHLEGLPEDIDTIELPGLRKPELQNISNDVCYTIRDDPIDPVDLPDFSELCADQPLCSPIYSSTSSYRTANTSTFPAGLSEELTPKPSPVTLEALSLILLTLPPPRRRRLHHLIRFMNKIAANHCLQLDPQHSNRYAVLKGLSGCIVSMGLESPPLCPSQCIHLVTVLLDYEHEVFAVPASLISDVDATVRERQREKVSTTEQCLERVPVLSEKQVQFCRPMKTDEYEDQNRHLNGNLLELLDQICADENLSVNEKRKRLKKFKKTYPKIYAQRFPSPELKEPKRKEKDSTFLSKLFGRLLPGNMCKYRLLSLIL